MLYLFVMLYLTLVDFYKRSHFQYMNLCFVLIDIKTSFLKKYIAVNEINGRV